jgi:hypothetical protein
MNIKISTNRLTCNSQKIMTQPLIMTPLTTWLGEIPGRVERWVDEGAFFGLRTMLSVVISHYDSIDLPSIDQGFTADRSNQEIDTF